MLLFVRVVFFSHLPVQGTDASSWAVGSMVPPSSDTSSCSFSLWTSGSPQTPAGTCIMPAQGQKASRSQDSFTQRCVPDSFVWQLQKGPRLHTRCPLSVWAPLAPFGFSTAQFCPLKGRKELVVMDAFFQIFPLSPLLRFSAFCWLIRDLSSRTCRTCWPWCLGQLLPSLFP